MVVGARLRKFLIVLALFFLFAVQPSASAWQSTRSAVYLIEKTYQVPNNGSTTAKNVVVTPIYIFDDRLDYAGQHVLSEEIKVDGVLASPEIYSEIRTGDNRIGSFSLGTINAGETKTITVIQIIRVDHVGPIDPSAVQGGMPSIDPIYTQPIPNLWESDDSVLKNKALDLIAGQSNPYYQAKALFDFVENHLTYRKMLPTVEYSALQAYNSRVGDCSEFTHLFSALCRAAGIPTRFVSGYCYDSAAGEAVGHAFTFIYLPGVGWTPMDLTWNRPKGMFGELSNHHLIQLTSDGRNLVEGTKIKIPGDCVEPRYTYSPPDPYLHVVASESITCLVGVEPKIYAGSKIQDSTWEFSIDVKNLGQSIDNVRVELQADSTYFEVPPAQEVGSLGSGMHRMVYFNLRVKQTVEDSFVTAIVTYDSHYGPFRAESQMPVSATIYEPPPEVVDLIPMLLLAAMAGAIAAILIVLVKRR